MVTDLKHTRSVGDMAFIQSLNSSIPADRATVGGKAVGLSRMTAGGVPVPPGFTVTTQAYIDFVDTNNLENTMDSLLDTIDFVDPDSIEAVSSQVRAHIMGATVPKSVFEEIATAYGQLGDNLFVAVRSSGTAEDMGDASFAGLYDSFLEIRGIDDVVDAVQRCWASLWTARCLSYRNHLGINHRQALVAVVVQEMVNAELAGVLFTANPLNARTDEIVINSAFGLGESIASGIVTPDEYILDQDTLAVKRSIIGAKEFRISRNPDGPGTVQRENTPAEKSVSTLSAMQAEDLAKFGRRAVVLAGGLPQDLEWAYRDGEFFILQSRDITGAEFMWDEDLEVGPPPTNDDEETWSNIWAQEYWTGAVTPLFYSIRGEELARSDRELFALWGFKELVPMRRFKYHRATVYFSSDADRQYYKNVLPSSLRKSKLANLPPEWRLEAGEAKFSVFKFLRMFVRMQVLTPDHGPLRQVKTIYALMKDRSENDKWPTAAELDGYTDEALIRELKSKMALFEDHLTALRPAFHIYAPLTFALLQEILKNWYSGDNEYAFADLMTGLPERTEMLQELVDQWELAEEIRNSPKLVAALDKFEGAAFFAELENSEEGRDFLDHYRGFLALHGHRGQQDRDLWHPRRSEDPMVDYRSFVTLVKAAAPSPAEMEHRMVVKRLESTAEVLESIRSKPFGALRVGFVKRLLEYIYKFLVVRDDERPFADLITMAKKRATTEFGKRLFARGLIEAEDDYFFLGYTEIEEVLAGHHQPKLITAKIKARREVFMKFVAREELPADYIRGDIPLTLEDLSATDVVGLFQGTGTSRGTVVGTARVIGNLDNIGRLQKGDILICNSTDPGWASAFGLISGLVLEAGGMLSHGACLSREYGLPAVTLGGAMGKISDGQTVSVDGSTGRVKIIDE